jgi:hypothetical protein
MKVSAFSGYSWPTHMLTIQAFFSIGIYFFYFISSNNCRLLTTVQVFDIMFDNSAPPSCYRSKWWTNELRLFVAYKGRWLTQAGYWFILRFCEHLTCLSSYMQNDIKLENISKLVEKYRNPHGQLKENLFLPLFNKNFISKSFGGPLRHEMT